MNNGSDRRITVSFNLDETLYDRLVKRLPVYGDRTRFFRLIVEKFLNDEIQVSINF